MSPVRQSWSNELRPEELCIGDPTAEHHHSLCHNLYAVKNWTIFVRFV